MTSGGQCIDQDDVKSETIHLHRAATVMKGMAFPREASDFAHQRHERRKDVDDSGNERAPQHDNFFINIFYFQ